MAKDTEKLKSEMQEANESLKKRNDNFVINSVAENIPTQSVGDNVSPAEKPVVQNAPKLSDQKGLIGDLQNKSIIAQSTGKHGVSAEIEKILIHLGELKAKIVEFERKFVGECENEIKHLKSLL